MRKLVLGVGLLLVLLLHACAGQDADQVVDVLDREAKAQKAGAGECCVN